MEGFVPLVKISAGKAPIGISSAESADNIEGIHNSGAGSYKRQVVRSCPLGFVVIKEYPWKYITFSDTGWFCKDVPESGENDSAPADYKMTDFPVSLYRNAAPLRSR